MREGFFVYEDDGVEEILVFSGIRRARFLKKPDGETYSVLLMWKNIDTATTYEMSRQRDRFKDRYKEWLKSEGKGGDNL